MMLIAILATLTLCLLLRFGSDSANVVPGSIPKATVNGVSFRYKNCRVSKRKSVINTSDSETGEWEGRKPDRRQYTVTCTGMVRFNVDPHAAPLSIGESDSVHFVYWPRGTEGANADYFYDIPNLVDSEFTEENNAEGTGAATYTLTGESDGACASPNESLGQEEE